MKELKKVVVFKGEIINVGELEELPEGAIVEEREMQYTSENGWREVGWRPPISENDLLKERLLATEQALMQIMTEGVM